MPDPISAIAGGSLLSAGVSAFSANEAANAQADAARQSADAQERMFQKQTELQEPFRQAGISAQNRLLDYMGLGQNPNAPGFGRYTGDFSMADFQADPGYAFRLAEGQKALDRSAAARGGLQSGAALKAAARYGQDMGSQEYTNAFNRYQTNRANQLNSLQSLMGSGQTSANTLTNAAGNLGQGLGQAAVAAGNARASGYMNMGNSLNNALSQSLNLYAQQPLLQAQTAAYNKLAGIG
jgi:hemoglobin-like flavoprotein